MSIDIEQVQQEIQQRENQYYFDILDNIDSLLMQQHILTEADTSLQQQITMIESVDIRLNKHFNYYNQLNQQLNEQVINSEQHDAAMEEINNCIKYKTLTEQQKQYFADHLYVSELQPIFQSVLNDQQMDSEQMKIYENFLIHIEQLSIVLKNKPILSEEYQIFQFKHQILKYLNNQVNYLFNTQKKKKPDIDITTFQDFLEQLNLEKSCYYFKLVEIRQIIQFLYHFDEKQIIHNKIVSLLSQTINKFLNEKLIKDKLQNSLNNYCSKFEQLHQDLYQLEYANQASQQKYLSKRYEFPKEEDLEAHISKYSLQVENSSILIPDSDKPLCITSLITPKTRHLVSPAFEYNDNEYLKFIQNFNDKKRLFQKPNQQIQLNDQFYDECAQNFDVIYLNIQNEGKNVTLQIESYFDKIYDNSLFKKQNNAKFPIQYSFQNQLQKIKQKLLLLCNLNQLLNLTKHSKEDVNAQIEKMLDIQFDQILKIEDRDCAVQTALLLIFSIKLSEAFLNKQQLKERIFDLFSKLEVKNLQFLNYWL